MGYDLETFGLAEMVRCSAALRDLGQGATSFEDVAGRVAELFYGSFVDPEGQRQFALVRFYKTHRFAELEPGSAAFAARMVDAALEEQTPCLTLVASVGEVEAWNSRRTSEGHRAIPLPSPAMVERFPMIAQLIRQFGLDVGELVDADPSLFVELDQRSYNVFHVEEAEGSPYVPAQAFVTEHGIRSVLGFGGVFPTGDLFAVIVFSKVRIERPIADLFKVLALSVKLPLLPFIHGPVFEEATDEVEGQKAIVTGDD